MVARDEKVDAWMPMFPRDFLAATEGLSAVDGWAYTRLLLHAWLEHGYLPYDPAELARLAKVTPLEWVATWGRLLRFFELADGRITQRRLLYELDRAVRLRRARADAGQKGGSAPRQTHQRSNASANARPTAGTTGGNQPGAQQRSKTEANTKPPPSPSPDQIPPTPRRRGGAPDESVSFQAWWQAYPRKAARERAWRAWQRTAPDHPPLPEMLRTLEWQRRLDFDRRPPDRVPYPATYLHGGQYRDEPPPEKGAASPRPPRRKQQQPSEPIDIATIMRTWPPKEVTPP